jgi:hypothetical protein
MMDFKAIIEHGESREVEFKQILELDTDAAKREFAKDISAMANSVEQEGYIVIGLADNGTPIGISKNPRLVETCQQVNSARCTPPVKYFSSWVGHAGKVLLLFRFPATALVPHSVDRTDVFIRRDTIVEKATVEEVYELKRRSKIETGQGQPDEPDLTGILHYEEKYEPMFFPLNGAPQLYRTVNVAEPFAGRAVCPVFMPHFGLHVPEPEIGDTRSAVMFDYEPQGDWYSRESMRTFLLTLERRIQELADRAGAWRVYPMSWGISQESSYTYGLSASNAMSAIENLQTGVLSAVFQFERVNVYKPTNWLVLLCEFRDFEEGRFAIRNFGLKLLLSSIPMSNGWVNYLFDSTAPLTGKDYELRRMGDDALMENMYTLNWNVSQNVAFKTDVIGLFGRDKSRDPDYDDGLGLVVKPQAFKKIKFELDEDESWHVNDYKPIFTKVPTECFDELVIEVTNPVPHWIDLKKGPIKIRAPRVKMAVVGIAGELVTPLNIRSFSAW